MASGKLFEKPPTARANVKGGAGRGRELGELRCRSTLVAEANFRPSVLGLKKYEVLICTAGSASYFAQVRRRPQAAQWVAIIWGIPQSVDSESHCLASSRVHRAAVWDHMASARQMWLPQLEIVDVHLLRCKSQA